MTLASSGNGSSAGPDHQALECPHLKPGANPRHRADFAMAVQGSCWVSLLPSSVNSQKATAHPEPS